MRLLVVLLAVSLFAAEDPWTEARRQNPEGIEFHWRIIGPSSYRQGELIQVEIAFPARSARSGRSGEVLWQFGGVLLDPAGECGAIEKPCMAFYSTRPPNIFHTLSGLESPEPRRVFLNIYLPFLDPGRYRLALLARKLVRVNRVPNSRSYEYADPPESVVSNTVELKLTAASKDWVEETVARCVRTLTGPVARTNSDYDSRHAAALQLSFLDEPAAWKASLDLLPTEEGMLLSGLLSSGHPAAVCSLMRERLAMPRQAVSSYYIQDMIRICQRRELPPFPGKSASKAMRTRYFNRERAYTADQNRQAYAALAAALARKTGQARLTALEALIRRVHFLWLNEPAEPAPDWIPTLRQVFVESLPVLDENHQELLLSMITGSFRWPELVPFCESLLDDWTPDDYFKLSDAAVRALDSVDPKRAQAHILKELPKPRTWLSVSHLKMLPPDAVPPMDDELIEALAAAQRPGGWNPELRMAALAKYGTRDALPRMRAIFESQQQPCQPQLLAYFVRVDPGYAGNVLDREKLDMHAKPPPCAIDYIQRTAPLAMAPVLQRYIATFLMHESVPVKQAAARALGQYGSATAAAPLWEAFRYLHGYFQGDRPPPTQEGVALERELRNAIAHSRNWLTLGSDLRLIESLCITSGCSEDTRWDLDGWKGAPRVTILWYGATIQGSVAQYRNMKSLAEMKAKLAQFPHGTKFLLDARRPAAQRLAADLKRFAGRRGFVITEIRK